VVVVWNFEIYMVPLSLLLLLTWNYFRLTSGTEPREGSVVSAFMSLMIAKFVTFISSSF